MKVTARVFLSPTDRIKYLLDGEKYFASHTVHYRGYWVFSVKGVPHADFLEGNPHKYPNILKI
jgi:hypothetical protein